MSEFEVPPEVEAAVERGDDFQPPVGLRRDIVPPEVKVAVRCGDEFEMPEVLEGQR